MSPWPLVPLEDFLKERQETVSADALRKGQIRIISKIGFGDGKIELRSTIETRTSMILVRPGDLVISGINATKGAIAVYDERNSEPVAATIHYGAYIPDKGKIDSRFLWWLLRSKTFRGLLEKYLPGGIKTELKAKRLLPIPVPLPHLEEQRRMRERIENLHDQIHQARALRKQSMDETDRLVISVHLELAGKRTRKLSDIMKLAEERVPVLPTGSYPQVGVKGFGEGLFTKPATSGTGTTYRMFNRLYEGAIVLSQVKGWEGALAVCSSDFAGWFVSPEYRTFRCFPKEARPEYLSRLVRTEWFWGRLGHATRGVGARRERTRPDQFLSLELPMPTMEQQKKAEMVFAEVDELRRVQAKTDTELDDTLSSFVDRMFDERNEI